MLEKLVVWLASQNPDSPARTEVTWFVVPHVNPDGRARNAVWSQSPVPTIDHKSVPDQGYDGVVARARGLIGDAELAAARAELLRAEDLAEGDADTIAEIHELLQVTGR